MLPVSRSEAEIENYMSEAARHSGIYYFPENLQAQAFDLALQFGRIALDVQGKDAPRYGASPEESQAIDRLVDVSLVIAGTLFRKIPMGPLSRLEREYRKRSISQVRTELFWQGDGTDKSPERRKGLYVDWAARMFTGFQGRLLTPESIAKVLHAEAYDHEDRDRLHRNANLYVYNLRLGIERKLQGLKLVRHNKFSKGSNGRQAGWVATPEGLGIPDNTISAGPVPSDDELRELAIKIRQEEIGFQRDRQEEAYRRQTDLEWQKRETAGLPPKEKNRQITSIFKQLEVDAKLEKRDAEKQARQEIAMWKREEGTRIEVPVRTSHPYGFTEREIEVFKLLPLGWEDNQIADVLHISRHTVKSYLKKIFDKTNTTSRTVAATLAYNTFKEQIKTELDLELGRYTELSPMEMRVLQAAGSGLGNKEIAAKFSIKPNTVNSHLRHIYTKLGIKRMQAGIFAQEAKAVGLSSPAASKFGHRPVHHITKSTTVRRQNRNEERVERETVSAADTELKKKMFRSDIERALFQVTKYLPGGHKLEIGQTYEISSPNGNDTHIWSELLERGIITSEQLMIRQVDRAAIVAAMLIKSGRDHGFLSGESTESSMELIRQEEQRYIDADKKRNRY